MVQQLQIIPDKIAPCISSMLFTLLSDARYEGNLWVSSKYCLPSEIAESRYKFNKYLGLISCLIDVVVLESIGQLQKGMYQEVLQLNKQINPVNGEDK